MSKLIDVLLKHRSCRSYKDKPVEDKKLKNILVAIQKAPHYAGATNVSAILIRDPEKRERMAEICGNQLHIAQAPVFLLLCGDFHKKAHISEAGEETHSLGPTIDETIIAYEETGIAIETATAAAEAQGLATVVIGAHIRDIQAMIEILDLPDLVIPLLGLCIGYPAEQPESVTEFQKESAVPQDKPTEGEETPARKLRIDVYDELYDTVFEF